ncbi:uncharacterized protein [Drosophila pseudoobscura]|uniref:Uncharacterized protein n=1 Tax=Drosophila pseudoobscura pseudoobscura TaxID=46245 RepID=A0A6I8V3A8_DROPS|nr:uncharacterized protein LOC6897634 [Drosophila pseudoobscura]
MSPRTISAWILVLWISCCELESACGREYQLRITRPDGTGFRTESVVEDAEGHRQIEGEIRQSYKEGGTLILFYKAGPDGYRSRYTYETGAPLNGTASIKRIGVNALKSSAG